MKDVHVPHTGTLRISRMIMRPMSLFESGESNGNVSLLQLFDNPQSFDGCESDLDLEALIFALCRGGWPQALRNRSDRAQLAVAQELYAQTYRADISHIDGVKRNPRWAQDILRSYARNICTLAQSKTLLADVQANCDIAKATYYDYVGALERLFIVEDVEAWCPAIRSKASIRSTVKRNLIDPSIAVAAMGLSPSYFNEDFKTLGFLFESLCIRDLKAYSAAFDGQMSHYRDRYGLEADGVLHLSDGRYALVEFKLGASEIDRGAEHLLALERLIREHNETESQCPLRLPEVKLVVTGTTYGYRREDGVLVVPIGCLRD